MMQSFYNALYVHTQVGWLDAFKRQCPITYMISFALIPNPGLEVGTGTSRARVVEEVQLQEYIYTVPD